MRLRLKANAGLKIEIIPGASLVGGGSAPTSTLPTHLLAITSERFSAESLASRLRAQPRPVVARVEEGRVLVDLRTVFEDEDEEVVKALLEVG